MSDFILSLIVVKNLLVTYGYLLAILGGGLLYYSYRQAMLGVRILATLILGVGLGSLLFSLISFLL